VGLVGVVLDESGLGGSGTTSTTTIDTPGSFTVGLSPLGQLSLSGLEVGILATPSLLI